MLRDRAREPRPVRWDEGGLGEVMERSNSPSGRDDEYQNTQMATGYSPDNTIFVALHSFAAYQHANWASCHGYNIPAGQLQEHSEAYTCCSAPTIRSLPTNSASWTWTTTTPSSERTWRCRTGPSAARWV